MIGSSSAIIRSLPLRQLQPRPPVAVAPLPEKTQFDRKLTVELNTLLSQGTSDGDIGLAQLLDTTITTQKVTLDSLVKISYKDGVDHVAIDEYLENNIEILDSCNYFVEKIENIKKYVCSLRVVARLVDNSGNAITSTHALKLLESCQSIEKRCKSKGNNGLRKILRQKLSVETEFNEIICGSKVMALMCCKFLDLGLSFESKSRVPSMKKFQAKSFSWLRLLEELAKQLAKGSAEKKVLKRRYRTSLLIDELQKTVDAAREMKEHMKGKKEKDMKSSVERLKRSCMELEDGLVIIEERVKGLYKSLIDVRMALLEIVSKACNF
ncbi:hypothetical protein Lal_00048842 [Lupinus albus]|uniref:Uncharacterized protein n=1 Tax=Lupinus albus TaxID=3870 RepID=A0A6A5N2N9_LUPAL|nr:hypothetical protein Lalb_Chr06g0168731 [Lupinus albus]KAF1880207.1 hypothetical protein Lal_00048842 [Lupinus albus]